MKEKDNIKCVPLRIPEELHRVFKTQVTKDGTNMNTKLTELLRMYLMYSSSRLGDKIYLLICSYYFVLFYNSYNLAAVVAWGRVLLDDFLELPVIIISSFLIQFNLLFFLQRGLVSHTSPSSF